MNFGPVTPELTEQFVNVWYNTAKKLAYLVESLDILDQFSQSFHHMKALLVQMMDLYFPICQGTLPWQPNNIGETRN